MTARISESRQALLDVAERLWVRAQFGCLMCEQVAHHLETCSEIRVASRPPEKVQQELLEVMAKLAHFYDYVSGTTGSLDDARKRLHELREELEMITERGLYVYKVEVIPSGKAA